MKVSVKNKILDPQIKGEGFFGFNLFNLCNLWIKKVFSLSGVARAMKVSVKKQ